MPSHNRSDSKGILVERYPCGNCTCCKDTDRDTPDVLSNGKSLTPPLPNCGHCLNDLILSISVERSWQSIHDHVKDINYGDLEMEGDVHVVCMGGLQGAVAMGRDRPYKTQMFGSGVLGPYWIKIYRRLPYMGISVLFSGEEI